MVKVIHYNWDEGNIPLNLDKTPTGGNCGLLCILPLFKFLLEENLKCA